MPRSKTITDSSYPKLLQDIRRLVARSQDLIERQTVLTYWAIGRSMEAYVRNDSRRGADTALARRLSGDLNIHLRTLQQALQFYRAYPRLDMRRPLSWSHYRILMTLDKPRERLAWEQRVRRDALGFDELRAAIWEARRAKTSSPDRLPAPSRGKLYHYRLIKVSYTSEAPGGIMLDCGFDIRLVPPPMRGTPVNKRIVEARKEDGQYSLVVSGAALKDIYFYKAVIEHVVDGDTLRANVDAGFGIWTKQYLRFNGIDAPETRSAAGIKAKRWLQQTLSRSPFVIARTHQSDKYDRYLADIYYAPRLTDPQAVAEQGVYLNQELLDRGLAQKFGQKI